MLGSSNVTPPTIGPEPSGHAHLLEGQSRTFHKAYPAHIKLAYCPQGAVEDNILSPLLNYDPAAGSVYFCTWNCVCAEVCVFSASGSNFKEHDTIASIQYRGWQIGLGLLWHADAGRIR